MTPGYQALADSAAILDLSDRGRIRVTGEDRARLLHAMTTNHVQGLKPGDGQYTFFLNAQGQIQADAYVLCFADHLLARRGAADAPIVYEHLDRFIIADDVTLEDVTEQTFALGLEGPQALRIAAEIGMTAPHAAFSHAEWDPYSVAAISFTGAPGVRVYGPALRKDDALETLANGGAIEASAEDAETFRITQFKPRYGRDITDRSLPQETQQTRAVHYQKGCYLGQEIVERVRSRGHINRLLMGFTGDSRSRACARRQGGVWRQGRRGSHVGRCGGWQVLRAGDRAGADCTAGNRGDRWPAGYAGGACRKE